MCVGICHVFAFMCVCMLKGGMAIGLIHKSRSRLSGN